MTHRLVGGGDSAAGGCNRKPQSGRSRLDQRLQRDLAPLVDDCLWSLDHRFEVERAMRKAGFLFDRRKEADRGRDLLRELDLRDGDDKIGRQFAFRRFR